jgi:hypothetical protein
MKITKRTAQKHLKAGNARLVGLVYINGETWMALDRLDLCRVDHYLVGYGDLR